MGIKDDPLRMCLVSIQRTNFEMKVGEKLKLGWTITEIARHLKVSDMRVTRVKLRLGRRDDIQLRDVDDKRYNKWSKLKEDDNAETP